MRSVWKAIRENSLGWLVTLGAATVILGLAGYLRTGVEPLDALYGVISLFTITFINPGDIGADSHEVPLALQIARFAAPVVTAGAAVTAIFILLRDNFELIRARLMKEHVIICGAGDRGIQLAIDFHEHGRQVVVIDRDAAEPQLSPLRHRHIPVINGDATDPAQMKRAKAGKAETIVIVLDDDHTNARTLTSLHEVPVEGGLQRVHCHVSSPSLDAYFTSRTKSAASAHDAAAGQRTIEWFNTKRLAANILLNEYFGTALQARSQAERLPGDGSTERTRPREIAIVGTSEMAHSLLLQAAMIWNELRRSSPNLSGTSDTGTLGGWPRLPVTVIDIDCAAWVETVRSMAPGLDDVVEIDCIETSPFVSLWDPSTVDVAYVTAPDPIEALEIAHYLDSMKSGRAQIVVRSFVGSSGLAAVLKGEEADPSIHMVNVIERTCTVEMISNRLIQLLALENHLFQQVNRPNRPVSKPWNELSPETRNENVGAAMHHVQVKLPFLNAKLVPVVELRGDEDGALELTDEEVESLTSLEYERCIDAGPSPSGQADRSPENWQHARDEIRARMRGLPLMFNACGYRLVRAGKSSRPMNREQPAVQNSGERRARSPFLSSRIRS